MLLGRVKQPTNKLIKSTRMYVSGLVYSVSGDASDSKLLERERDQDHDPWKQLRKLRVAPRVKAKRMAAGRREKEPTRWGGGAGGAGLM